MLVLVTEHNQHGCLQVVRLWDFHGLQGDGGDDVVGALRYPTLGRPVEGGSHHAGLLQLRVAGRVQVHLGQLECDRPGRLLKAAEGSGHPVIDTECEGRPFITTVLRNASPFPHRLKLLYSGRSARGSSGGIFSWMVSARLGSLRISWSHGEWYDFGIVRESSFSASCVEKKINHYLWGWVHSHQVHVEPRSLASVGEVKHLEWTGLWPWAEQGGQPHWVVHQYDPSS